MTTIIQNLRSNTSSIIIQLLLLFIQTTSSSSTTSSQCKEWGFDPATLSCDTCDLLSPHIPLLSSFIETECRSCCQPFLQNDPLETIYRSAILIKPSFGGMGMFFGGGSTTSDMDEFIEKDWDELVEQKGEDYLMSAKGVWGISQRIYFFRSGGPNLDDLEQDVESWETKLEDADEMVPLHGWKRDDIRELLANSLPDLN